MIKFVKSKIISPLISPKARLFLMLIKALSIGEGLGGVKKKHPF